MPPNNRITYIPQSEKARRYNLIEGNTKLKLRCDEVKEIFLDPIITGSLELIERKLNESKRDGYGISNLILIGRFSHNRYLQQRIKDKYQHKVDIIIPEQGSLAASQGAVSYGLNSCLISTDLQDNIGKNRLHLKDEISQQLKSKNRISSIEIMSVEGVNTVVAGKSI